MCKENIPLNIKIDNTTIDNTTICNEFNDIFWDCFRNHNYSIKQCSKSYYDLIKCIKFIKTPDL